LKIEVENRIKFQFLIYRNKVISNKITSQFREVTHSRGELFL